MGKITILDIAREAQVSKATVSRVLNKPEIVDASTREQVQRVIDKYHYRPSALARNMSIQRTSSIGVVIPEVDNPFFGSVLRGAIRVLEKKGYTIVCFNTDEKPGRDIKALQDLISYKYSGLLYTPVQEFSHIKEQKEIRRLLKQLDVPVVLVDRNFPELSQYDSVYFDDRNGIAQAVVALAEMGHQKIGFLNANPSYFLAKIRNDGYRMGLERCNIPFEEKYLYSIPRYSMEDSYAKSCEILQSKDRPTAMITGNNSITLGFLKALSEFGLQLGKDIECIGLDRIKELDIIGTNLSYILRTGEQVGEVAAQLLLERMEDANRPVQSIRLDHKLVIRKS